MADVGRRSARGGAAMLLSQVAKFALSVLSQVVLARLLTPEIYGLFGMVMAVAAFLMMFKDLGLSVATVQVRELTSAQVSTLFYANVLAGVILAGIVCASAPLLAYIYSAPILMPVTMCLSGAFIVSALGVQHSALLSRQMCFRQLAAIEVAAIGSAFIVAVALAIGGRGIWALVAFEVVRAGVPSVLAWTFCSWRPGRPAPWRAVRSLIGLGGHVAGFNAANYFSRNFDNVLIGLVWGAQPLGLYVKAYQLLLLPLSQVNAPIQSVAVPALSRLLHQPDRYRRAYFRAVAAVCLITVPAVIFMAACRDWLILTLLGQNWIGAGDIFLALSLAGLVQPMASTTGWLFMSQARGQQFMRWGVIGSSIAVMSFFVGLPWGAKGVAISYAMVQCAVVVPLLLKYAGREGPVQFHHFYRFLWPLGVAATSSTSGAFLLRALLPQDRAFTGLIIIGAIVPPCFVLSMMMTRSGRELVLDIVRVASRHLREGNRAPQTTTSSSLGPLEKPLAESDSANLSGEECDSGARPPSLAVVSIPAFQNSELNPYTSLLAKGLSFCGVRVEEGLGRPLTEILRHRPDIVHIHWPESSLQKANAGRAAIGMAFQLSRMITLRISGARLVWTVHNLRPHDPRHPRLAKLMMGLFSRLVDGWISLSRPGVAAAVGEYPALARRPHVVIAHGHYRGVYPAAMSRDEARKRLEIPPDASVVAFLGQLRAYKNVEHLIEVFRGIGDPKARLVVAGAASEEDYAERLRELASADSRVRLFPLFVAPNDIQTYLRAADLVVLPYRAILNSGSVLLSLSFDRPTLVPAIGSLAELADNVGPAWLRVYDGELSTEELRTALAWATDKDRSGQPDLRSFDWPGLAEETVVFYRRVIGSNLADGRPSNQMPFAASEIR